MCLMNRMQAPLSPLFAWPSRSKHSARDLPHARTSVDAFKTIVGYEEVVGLQERCGG